jgi:hypothetical protein
MQDEIVEVLKDIRRWIRASSYGSVGDMLRGLLKDDRLRLVYQLSDGSRSRDEVKVIAKVGSGTVTDLWQACVSMGLMDVIGGKRIRQFDLRDFGLITTETVDVAIKDSAKATADSSVQAK